MKRIIVQSIVFILVWITSIKAENKMRIAIMDLQPVNMDENVTLTVSDLFRTEMVKLNLFTIIERQAINDILKEQEIQLSGVTETESAVEIGQLLSANKILVGTLSKLGNDFIINVRIIDVKKGIMEFAESVRVISESRLGFGCRMLAQKISYVIKKGKNKEVIDKDGLLNEIETYIDTENYDEARIKIEIFKTKIGVTDDLKELIEECNEKEADFYYEKAQKEYDDWNLSTALEKINKAIALNKEESDYYDIKNQIIKGLQAESYYNESLKKYELDDLDSLNLAKNLIKKALDIKELDKYEELDEKIKEEIDKLETIQEEKEKTPAVAFWRSVILPGWGQFYNRQYLKGTLFFVIYGASLYGTYFYYKKFMPAYDEYKKAATAEDATAKYKIANKNFLYLQYCGYTAIGILLWSAFDASIVRKNIIKEGRYVNLQIKIRPEDFILSYKWRF